MTIQVKTLIQRLDVRVGVADLELCSALNDGWVVAHETVVTDRERITRIVRLEKRYSARPTEEEEEEYVSVSKDGVLEYVKAEFSHHDIEFVVDKKLYEIEFMYDFSQWRVTAYDGVHDGPVDDGEAKTRSEAVEPVLSVMKRLLAGEDFTETFSAGEDDWEDADD